MKKIIFGQFFKLLTLAISISILAACGASDAIDAINDIDSGGEVLGNITVEGGDTDVIGSSFSPTANATTDFTDNFGVVAVALGDATVDIFAQSGVGRVLGVAFNLDETVLSISYGVNFTDGDIDYKYTRDCVSNPPCSATVDIASSTITFSNSDLFVDPDLGNSASDFIRLNGSTRYRVQ